MTSEILPRRAAAADVDAPGVDAPGVDTPGVDTPGVDTPGRIETRGIDYIPEAERHSRPRNLAWVFFGTQMTYGSVVVGALPIAFGLGWWDALTAIVSGTVLGSLAVAMMALLGPRTGTNSTVSSAAFFGIRGRYVGSFITQVIDLGYFAMVLWISVPPILEAGHRLFATPVAGPVLTSGLVLMALVTLALGVFGHATIVAYQKLTSVVSFISLLLLVWFAASRGHAPPTAPKLILGGFWPSWALATTIQIANAISYAPYVGDYARYIPSAAKPRALLGWCFFGMVAGCVLALGAGAVIGLSVPDPGNVTSAMMATVPLPLLIPVALLGLVGNVTNGGMVVYNGTLDLHAVLWRLRRVQVALIFGAVGLAFGYVGLVMFRLADSIVALCSVVTVLVTPWIMINIIGYWQHRGEFDVRDLQAFTRREPRGLYWYSAGANPGAVAAWAIGVVIGLLFSDTSLFTGPLAHAAHGVDLSFISSAIVAALLYLLLGRVHAARGAERISLSHQE